jgi:hypothetical protein
MKQAAPPSNDILGTTDQSHAAADNHWPFLREGFVPAGGVLPQWFT